MANEKIIDTTGLKYYHDNIASDTFAPKANPIFTGTVDTSSGNVKISVLNARTSSSSTTYGPGTSSQVLKSNGTNCYWGSDANDTTTIGGGAIYKAKNAYGGYSVLITNRNNELVPTVSGSGYTTATSKTMNTSEAFDPFGIYAYTGSSSNRAAGALCSGSTYIIYSSFDIRYAFNITSDLTANAPFYIVAQLQNDGQAKLVSPYYSQTLPSSDNGKIYILLGQALSTTNISLVPNHPIYYYKDSRIYEYSGDNIVDLTSNQTINGTKTFTNRPRAVEVYTKLAYIQSNAGSGFPYIRTGVFRDVQYTNKLTCVLDGYFTESQTYGFCGYDSGGQLGQKNGKWSTENDGLGTTNVNCIGSSNRATVRQVLDFTNNTNKLYIGDTMVAGRNISNTAYSQQADYPIFVAYSGAYTYNPAKLVLYSFKMYDGDTTGTLIRDFIPVRNSANEVGLLDLVEGKFYRNQGSTSFVAGSDVETISVGGPLLTSSDVGIVALTNSYNDLDNKPSIPAAVTSVNGLSGGTINGDVSMQKLTVLDEGIEIFDNTTPYIDFHYQNNGADYTARIIETPQGVLDIQGNSPYLKVNGNAVATKNEIPSSTKGITYLTTAPSAANTDGGLIIVVLSSEPATKYDGYIYLITE